MKRFTTKIRERKRERERELRTGVVVPRVERLVHHGAAVRVVQERHAVAQKRADRDDVLEARAAFLIAVADVKGNSYIDHVRCRK